MPKPRKIVVYHGEHKSVWYVTEQTTDNPEEWEVISSHSSYEDARIAISLDERR